LVDRATLHEQAHFQLEIQGNPLRESSNLQIVSTIHPDLKLAFDGLIIYSTNGQQVFRTEGVGKTSFQLYRENLQPGMYLIKAWDEHGHQFSDKLIVQ
ncbi:MAG: T9SS type A sorting domain-containing protein, partial [Bacteroidota bacterium]